MKWLEFFSPADGRCSFVFGHTGAAIAVVGVDGGQGMLAKNWGVLLLFFFVTLWLPWVWLLIGGVLICFSVGVVRVGGERVE
jgi:hypothetical protein